MNLEGSWCLKNSHYEWVESEKNVIGKGAFGEVRKVRHNLDQGYYAMKKIPILSLVSINIIREGGGLQKLLREVQLQSQINCENVVKYFTSWIEGENAENLEEIALEYSSTQRLGPPVDFLYIVLELCDTDLKKWLKKHKTIENREKDGPIRYGLYQLAKGLKAMHDLDIIHRDLKPSNILLKRNKDGHDSKYTWKIGDLGLSRFADADSNEESGVKGNLAYMAFELTEVIPNSIFPTTASDVYSLGLILFEVIFPIATETQRTMVHFNISRDDKPNNAINKYLKSEDGNGSNFEKESEIIKKMLVKYPVKRCTINQVVKHFETIIGHPPTKPIVKTNQANPKQKHVKSVTNSSHKLPNPYKRPIRHEIIPPVSTFSGRKGELYEIAKGFNSRDNKTFLHNVVVIEGLGGIGKTNLARKFAQLFSEQSGGDIIWITAETSATLLSSLGRLYKNKLKLEWNSEIASDSLCRLYNIFQQDVGFQPKTTDGKEVVKLNLRKSSTLIIFDNAEIWKDNSGLGLRDYFPHFHDFYSSDYKIPYFLVTTRKKDFIARSVTLKLKPLRTEEAIAFVCSILDCSQQDAKLLCDTLQNFPLALQQAVGYIKENEGFNYGIEEYVKAFEHRREEAKKLLQYNFTENSDDTYELTTFTVWKITLDKILKMNQTSIDVISVLSFLPADNVECRFLRDYFRWSKKLNQDSDINNALLIPSKYSMYVVNGDKISVHRLVQKVVRLNLAEEVNGDESLLKSLLEFIRDYVLVSEVDISLSADNVFGFQNQPEPSDDYFDYIFAIWKHAQEKPNLLKEFYTILLPFRKKLSMPPKTDEAKMLSQTFMKIHDTFSISELETLTEAIQQFYKYMSKTTTFWYDEGIRIWELLCKYSQQYFGPMDQLSLSCTEEYLDLLTKLKKLDLCLPLYEAEYEKRCQLFHDNSEQAFQILRYYARAQSQADIEKGFEFFFKVLEKAKTTFPGDEEVLQSIKKEIVMFAHYGLLLTHNTKDCRGYGKIVIEVCRELYELEKLSVATDAYHFRLGNELVWFLKNEGDKLREIVEVYEEMVVFCKEFGLKEISEQDMFKKLQLARIHLVQQNIRNLFSSTLPTIDVDEENGFAEDKKAKAIVVKLRSSYEYN